jgi:hypothetical protein
MAGPTKPPVPVKARDEIVGGVYANSMMVSHSREEFVLDFFYLSPQMAVLNARVITSPGHLKRIIRALSENLRRYEEAHGEIREAAEPKRDGNVN